MAQRLALGQSLANAIFNGPGLSVVNWDFTATSGSYGSFSDGPFGIGNGGIPTTGLFDGYCGPYSKNAAVLYAGVYLESGYNGLKFEFILATQEPDGGQPDSISILTYVNSGNELARDGSGNRITAQSAVAKDPDAIFPPDSLTGYSRTACVDCELTPNGAEVNYVKETTTLARGEQPYTSTIPASGTASGTCIYFVAPEETTTTSAETTTTTTEQTTTADTTTSTNEPTDTTTTVSTVKQSETTTDNTSSQITLSTTQSTGTTKDKTSSGTALTTSQFTDTTTSSGSDSTSDGKTTTSDGLTSIATTAHGSTTETADDSTTTIDHTGVPTSTLTYSISQSQTTTAVINSDTTTIASNSDTASRSEPETTDTFSLSSSTLSVLSSPTTTLAFSLSTTVVSLPVSSTKASSEDTVSTFTSDSETFITSASSSCSSTSMDNSIPSSSVTVSLHSTPLIQYPSITISPKPVYTVPGFVGSSVSSVLSGYPKPEQTQLATAVTTVTYTIVNPNNPSYLTTTEYCAILSYQLCSSCSYQPIPTIAMTTVTVSCNECGKHGQNTVTITAPCAAITEPASNRPSQRQPNFPSPQNPYKPAALTNNLKPTGAESHVVPETVRTTTTLIEQARPTTNGHNDEPGFEQEARKDYGYPGSQNPTVIFGNGASAAHQTATQQTTSSSLPGAASTPNYGPKVPETVVSGGAYLRIDSTFVLTLMLTWIGFLV
ncbi:putative membrane protein ycf1 [Fusarium austroafricanum]|uniref:Putative membrane protein ycf1 n=1 Tax=Fusarium austroafricanum TaxID=2364996 RepID=A0A8H4KKD7_9HYPO|nr:putative membrane protein ycf1 [Fusarium austroafricanum]